MPALETTDPRLVFLPRDQILAASGICDARRDDFWVVHPDKGLVLYQIEKRRYGQLRGASPQCNKHELVARSFVEKFYPWATIERIPLVLVPVDIRDYA